MKKEIQWFVEPLDSHSNKVIHTLCQSEGDACDMNIEKDRQGKILNVFRCPSYQIIIKLTKSKSQQDIDFRVHKRRGKEGPLDPWPFSTKKKKVKL